MSYLSIAAALLRTAVSCLLSTTLSSPAPLLSCFFCCCCPRALLLLRLKLSLLPHLELLSSLVPFVLIGDDRSRDDARGTPDTVQDNPAHYATPHSMMRQAVRRGDALQWTRPAIKATAQTHATLTQTTAASLAVGCSIPGSEADDSGPWGSPDDRTRVSHPLPKSWDCLVTGQPTKG